MIRVSGVGKYFSGRVVLKKSLTIGGAVTATVVLGLAGYVLTQDLGRFVPGLDERLSREIGQEVKINGPLRLGLAWGDALWLSARDVSIKPQEGQSFRADIDQVRVRVSLLPLFRRTLLAELTEIRGGSFLMESGATPGEVFDEIPGVITANAESDQEPGGWTFGGLHRLEVKRSVVGVIDDGQDVFTFPVSNFFAEPVEAGLTFRLKGQIEGRSVVFEGKSGPLAALLDGARVYFEGMVKSGSAHLSLNGSIGDPALDGLEFLVRGGAENLDDVAALLGYGDLDRETSMSVTAHIKATTTTLVVKDLALEYGRGDLSGWFSMTRGERIDIDGELRSDFLDLQAFEGGHSLHPSKRLFSDAALPVDFIRKLDGEFQFKAKTILLANARLVDGQINMVASSGVVALNPITVSYEDGLLDGSLVLYARDVPGFKGAGSLINFDVGNFLTAAKMTEPFEARLNFGAKLQGEGRTVAEMLGNAEGQTNLVMGKGRLGPEISDLLGGREAAGLTPIEAKESGVDVIDLRCLVSRFDVSNGVGRSRAFLVETSDSVTTGKGQVSLKSERIDLHLAPRPRNPAFLDQAADLKISGSLLEPTFRVDQKKMSKGLAGSLGRFAGSRRDDENLLPLLDAAVTNKNPCIVALTGQKKSAKGRSGIYGLTQAR